MSERMCLQCNESEAAIRASQRRRDPIFCGAVDYFGECLWEADRHRFRDWSDRELAEWGVLPEFYDQHRRMLSLYDVPENHRTNGSPDA